MNTPPDGQPPPHVHRAGDFTVSTTGMAGDDKDLQKLLDGLKQLQRDSLTEERRAMAERAAAKVAAAKAEAAAPKAPPPTTPAPAKSGNLLLRFLTWWFFDPAAFTEDPAVTFLRGAEGSRDPTRFRQSPSFLERESNKNMQEALKGIAGRWLLTGFAVLMLVGYWKKAHRKTIPAGAREREAPAATTPRTWSVPVE